MSDQHTIDLGIEGLSEAVHLGAGGSANVFAARRLDTGEDVAVKLLRASADSEKERQRFEREKETLDRLSTRDGIVPILDAGMTDRKEPYFLMPIMEGSLQDRIEAEGALEWEMASQLMVQVAETVEFAHEHHVLHRDLKPGNILVDAEGVPRVADFGIAKLLDTSTSKSSKSMGTPSFMPPERFRGDEATEVSDVYGLGATLAALVTGTPPFITGENDTDAAVMMRVVNDAPPNLATMDIPHPVADLVTVSMAKDPADRPASAAEFANRLRAAVTNSGAPVPAAPVTVAVPRRNLDLSFAAVGAAGAAGAAASLASSPATPPSSGATQSPAAGAPVDLAEEDDDDRTPAAWIQFAGAAAVVFIIGLLGILFLARDGDTTGDTATGEPGEVTESADDTAGDAADGGTEAGLGDVDTEVDGLQQIAADSDDGVTGAEPAKDGTDSASGDATADADGESGFTVKDSQADTGDAAGDPSGEGDNGDTAGDTGTDGTDNGDDTTTGETPDTGTTPTTPPAAAPEACFAASATAATIGQNVSFSNCSEDATSQSWDFGDGATSTSSGPSHSWDAAGTYTVRLTARGPGGTDATTRTITVSAPATTDPPATADPSACFTASASSVEVGENVAFSNCSDDATSYLWNFGDGETSTWEAPSHSWDAAGSYTVRLTAENDGGTDSATKTITVKEPEPKPVACFNASATSVTINQSVSFTNCSEHATSYAWNFGDGDSSTSATPSHSWSSAGTYTVRLTANGPGGSHSTTRSITVSAPQPTPDFVGTIEIGDLDETFVKYRFKSDTTTTYTAVVKSGGSTVATASGTATADQLVNITANGLTADSDYTIQVTLNGSPAKTATATIRTPGGTPPVATEQVQLLNLRITETQSTRVQLNYESNICANGSFVISESGGGQVGSNAGQADGCGTNHLAIPGFWTNALKPNTTYTITVTVEANGRGQGNGNTATKSLTFTTAA